MSDTSTTMAEADVSNYQEALVFISEQGCSVVCQNNASSAAGGGGSGAGASTNEVVTLNFLTHDSCT